MKKKDRESRGTSLVASGEAIKESVAHSVAVAEQEYYKPTYKGNRALYDDASAKIIAKQKAFSNSSDYIDPYTGEVLKLKRLEARVYCPDDYSAHCAEADHIEPLSRVVSANEKEQWLKAEDIKNGANSQKNIKVVSRKLNNAKRDKTNSEFYSDGEYLAKKDIELSQDAKNQAISDGETAQNFLDEFFKSKKISNTFTTCNHAGIASAKTAAIVASSVSVINNTVSVIKNEKDIKTAAKDVIIDTSLSTGVGYVTGFGLTCLEHSFASSNSKFVQQITNHSTVGSVCTAGVSVGRNIVQAKHGKISSEDAFFNSTKSVLSVSCLKTFSSLGKNVCNKPLLGSALGIVVGTVVIDKGVDLVHKGYDAVVDFICS